MRTTALRQAPTAHTKRALLSRHHIVAPSLCVADAAAASVFGAARSRGPIARDVIAKVTQLFDRDGEPPSHRPAGRRRPTGTRRPRGVRRDRQAAGAGRGQPRTVPDAGHPHRRADHQHRGHRPVRSHPRRRRDPDAAGRAGGRPRVARGQRASLPEPLAPAPPAVGRRGRGRRRRQHDRLSRPPEAGLVGRARRAGARRIARAAGVGRVACGRDGRGRTAAGYAPGVLTARDEPVRLRPRNRRLRAVDRREGPFAGQRPGHHRRLARPLGSARRYRAARVDGQRRGGAHRGA